MVWTDDLLARFLDQAAEHAPDLHPLLHVMAYCGPSGSEARGLLRQDGLRQRIEPLLPKPERRRRFAGHTGSSDGHVLC
ncbi:hypothetical protein [Micromonospora sp. L32]|uniref:hypothetical protein n=1 Tax=Micromonospora sp. L32 TaxID=3452214 RepID=UPI003F896758